MEVVTVFSIWNIQDTENLSVTVFVYALSTKPLHQYIGIDKFLFYISKRFIHILHYKHKNRILFFPSFLQSWNFQEVLLSSV